MKLTEDLTIAQVQMPPKDLSEDELHVAEEALLRLLYNWETESLKPRLRATLQREINNASNPDAAFLLNQDLMRPAELYQLLNAVQLLGKHLVDRCYDRIERKAAMGDPDAIEELAQLNSST